jgi:hypothetical protein
MHGLVEVGHISTIAIVPPAYILFSRHEKRESERKERKKITSQSVRSALFMMLIIVFVNHLMSCVPAKQNHLCSCTNLFINHIITSSTKPIQNI